VSHLVIGQVSQHLRHVLWLGLSSDPVTRQQVTNELNIVLSNPSQPAGTPNANVVRQLSLWLYQVLPNEHLRNAPPVRARDPSGDDTTEFYPPLALNLYYLLTPSTGNDVGDQQVLGRTLQIFHDQSILRMESTQSPERAEELHISLAPRTIEELAEVWEAMQQPYRLSVCYEIRVARIDSQRKLPGGRVADRESHFEPSGA
jgi:hypothetical protein